MFYVTGSFSECLGVVGLESWSCQIPELTGPIQWLSATPGSTRERQRKAWERRQQAWEHVGAPTTTPGAPATTLGAPRITVEQSGKNNIFFGNAAGVPGNHSYYVSFTDF